MSEKYKLIKKLPFENSPEIGYISKPKAGANGAHYWNHNWFDPKDYPEFWEKAVEKDYEILSFKAKTDVEQYRILDTDTGLYKYFDSSVKIKYSKEYLIQEGSYQIHSVKRLSDGEIFTLGDKVDSTISDLGGTTDITGFKIMNNELKVGLRHLGYYPLSTIILPKNPLFTTEDGVDIFEGDKYYFVITSSFLQGTNIAREKKGPKDYPLYKYFSSKEAAEEYILMNKPSLSIKEIAPLFGQYHLDNSISALNRLTEKLKEIVKSKL